VSLASQQRKRGALRLPWSHSRGPWRGHHRGEVDRLAGLDQSGGGLAHDAYKRVARWIGLLGWTGAVVGKKEASVGRLGGLARAHVGGNASGRKLGLARLPRPIWPFLFPLPF
jgi:hypothetical protein